MLLIYIVIFIKNTGDTWFKIFFKNIKWKYKMKIQNDNIKWKYKIKIQNENIKWKILDYIMKKSLYEIKLRNAINSLEYE